MYSQPFDFTGKVIEYYIIPINLICLHAQACTLVILLFNLIMSFNLYLAKKLLPILINVPLMIWNNLSLVSKTVNVFVFKCVSSPVPLESHASHTTDKGIVLFDAVYTIAWWHLPSPELNKNPVEGFSAGLIDENDLYRWEVLIIGPPDTH